MKKKIIVIGAGMVGRAIAADLSDCYYVTVIDLSNEALLSLKEEYNVHTIRLDASDPAQLSEAIRPFDLVISAVPGHLGWQTLNTVIKSRKDIVDISFLPEDVLPLDKVAKEFGVTAIVDCGVAPGIPNIIAGYYNERMKVNRFEYMVGGLPFVRKFPFEYKAPFSPCDVIEEYIRPARFKENGTIVTKPALSDAELVYFEETGTLEAFNSDGLRSLLYTLPSISNMKEKTLRYPGHINIIKKLKASGFFSKNSILVNDCHVIPFEVTSQILKDEWKLLPNEKEFTIMSMLIEAEKNNETIKMKYKLYDKFDDKTKTSSMARTTGYTCTAAANMILKENFSAKGLFPPEKIGVDQKHFDHIFNYLAEREVALSYTEF